MKAKNQKTTQEKLKEIYGSLSILLNYILTDIEKKPRSFKIGVFSIFLVVTFLVVLQSALTLTPGIFLRLAENEAGQSDFTMTPVSATNDTRLANSSSTATIFRGLNFTEMSSKLQGLSTFAAATPRWLVPITVSDPSTPDQNNSILGLAIDSKHEREQGFGTHLEIKDLGTDECWISGSTSRLVKLSGDSIRVHFDAVKSLSDMQILANGNSSSSSDPNAYVRGIALLLIKQQLEANGGVAVSDDVYSFGSGTGTIQIGRRLQLINQVGEITTNWDELNISIPVNFTDVPENPTMDDVTFLVNVSRLADTLAGVLRKGLTVDHNFKVVETIESPKGKWASNLGNLVVLDSNQVLSLIENYLVKVVNETELETDDDLTNEFIQRNLNKTEMIEQIHEMFAETRLEDYALMVNFLTTDRKSTYSSQKSVKPALIKASNSIYSRLGKNHPSVITAPLDTALTSFFLFKNFLDNIFNSTVFILILLSGLLIYSLMNSNVEEKTYEFGMLRALGMQKMNLTTLLIVQSMFFAIPGLALGLILSFTLNFMASYYISNMASLPNSTPPSGSALALGFCIALIIPFFSNYLPIRKALTKTLRDSLNIYNRTISDLTVKIMKLAKMGISPAQTVGALTLIVMGFLTYYLAPYSFIFQNISLFFIILNIVMMMMVIGFTLLLNLLQPACERLILKFFIFPLPKERALEPVIIKNFAAHRQRNTKTSLMFSIALAFLIYAGTGFRLNSNIVAKTLEVYSGSDLVIQTVSSSSYLNETELRSALEEFRGKFPDVMKDYTFVSGSFNDQPATATLRFSSLSRDPNRKVRLYSVDQTYLNSAYEDHFVGVGYDSSIEWPNIRGTNKKDAVAGLYNSDGLETGISYDSYNIIANAMTYNLSLGSYVGQTEIRVLIPEGLSIDVSTEAGSQALLRSNEIYLKSRVRSISSKLPGFLFSSYRTTGTYEIVTSHEDFAFVRSKVWGRTASAAQQQEYLKQIPEGSSENVGKQSLLIRYNTGVSSAMRGQAKNSVGTKLDSTKVLVIDVVETVISLRETLVFIDIFFILVTIIAISLSFFFTIISFTSNITENAWEFGVLRAIGLSKNQMMKIYVLEALSLILAAASLGTLVGLAVATTSSIMFYMFTELPFELEFPLAVFFVALISSVITAFLSSKIAVDKIKNKQISSIIKALE